jgi:hypothetical protein
MTMAYSRKFIWECFHQSSKSVKDDSFSRWLRDKKSVKIDWSTFGLTTLDAKQPH